MVGIAGHELDRLLSSQTKSLLQLKTHSDVLVPYFGQIRLYYGFGLTRVGHEYPVWNPVMVVGSCHHILPIYFPRPPANGGHPVLDGACGYVRGQSVANQPLDMLWFEGMTVHASKPNHVQLVRHQRELALPPDLSSKAPFPIVPAELFQLVVQASQ